jgi:hypothetical protein
MTEKKLPKGCDQQGRYPEANEDVCKPSTTGEHEWRPFLSGGYKCVYCGTEWVPVEPCVDPDEIEAHKYVEPEPEPLWPKVVGVAIAIILIGLVFGPVGVIK